MHIIDINNNDDELEIKNILQSELNVRLDVDDIIKNHKYIIYTYDKEKTTICNFLKDFYILQIKKVLKKINIIYKDDDFINILARLIYDLPKNGKTQLENLQDFLSDCNFTQGVNYVFSFITINKGTYYIAIEILD